MRFLNRFKSGLAALLPARRNKNGASLALVMMIGAALVIWVMCLLPLMATTGEVTYGTQDDYAVYLSSRSSIEYTKSELEKIVENTNPYSFAVIRIYNSEKGRDEYTAIPREINGYDNDDYFALTRLAPGQVEDFKGFNDIPDPNGSAEINGSVRSGNDVVAICAVSNDPDSPHIYEIQIRTFYNCTEGLTYSLTYIPAGNLMIHPEAYDSGEAMPLSDYVQVDGIMGGIYDEDGEWVANKIWDSNIDTFFTDFDKDQRGNKSEIYYPRLKEYMLPFVENPGKYYASSGEYPAVFKQTATAATSSGEQGETKEQIVVQFTDEKWILPKAFTGDTSTPKQIGDVWCEISGSSITVKVQTGPNDADVLNITKFCTVYANGASITSGTDVTHKVPSAPGVYRITADYEGTGTTYSETAPNILPFTGLELTTVDKKAGTGGAWTFSSNENNRTYFTKEADSVRIEFVSDSQTYGDIMYGYYTSDNEEMVWRSSTATTTKRINNKSYTANYIDFNDLDPQKSYYFYICRIAGVDSNGKYRTDAIRYVGTWEMPQFATKLEAGAQYMIYSGEEEYALYVEHGWFSPSGFASRAVPLGSADSINEQSRYLFTAVQDDNQQWNLIYDYESLLGGGTYYVRLNGSCKRSGWRPNYTYSWSFSTDLSSSANPFNISFDGVQATLSRKFTNNNYNQETTGYFGLNSSGSFGSQDATTTVRFLKIPFEGTSAKSASQIQGPTPLVTVDLGKIEYSAVGDRVVDLVKNKLADHTLTELYANGTKVTGMLNSGSYEMYAKIDDKYYVYLGVLKVNPKALDAEKPSILVTQVDPKNELQYKVSGDPSVGWHDHSGTKYVGFYQLAEGESYSEGNYPDDTAFSWFAADEYTFDLGYNRYLFALKESGDTNYIGQTKYSTITEVKSNKWTPSEDQTKNQFEYVFVRDETLPAGGKFLWYVMPEGLNPLRIEKLVFGVPVENSDDITWVETYNANVRFYGVYIENSDYSLESGNFYRLPASKAIKHYGGATSSMMRGKSLYFLGRDASINTKGNDIYLTTDLLVLNGDIVDYLDSEINSASKDENGTPIRGMVRVEPYSSTANGTLLYVSDSLENGRDASGISTYKVGPFEAGKFYLIPPNTDIHGLTASEAAGMVQEEKDVDRAFMSGAYPKLNLDLAYASIEQLMHIVSGETIGWTENGKLLVGEDGSNTNSKYVVCPFINDIATGDATAKIHRKANRVLLAAREYSADGVNFSRTLTVPTNLYFTVRYVSIHADQVKQAGSADREFKIYTLGLDASLIATIKSYLQLSTYSSKTLQIEFERVTSFFDPDMKKISTSTVGTNRYDDGDLNDKDKNGNYIDNGVDLFDKPQIRELMVSYSAQEIDDITSTSWGDNYISKIVDRYIKIEGKEVNVEPDLPDGLGSLVSFVDRSLYMYTNFLYLGPERIPTDDGTTAYDYDPKQDDYSIRLTLRIKKNILGGTYSANWYLNSQETGYTSEEYLFFFVGHTAETYNGTMIQVGPGVEIEVVDANKNSVVYPIAPGFYYFDAIKTNIGKNGKSILGLTENQVVTESGAVDGSDNPYWVPLDKLGDYSIYFDENGFASDTYVDSGYTATDVFGASGFLGGGVQ